MDVICSEGENHSEQMVSDPSAKLGQSHLQLCEERQDGEGQHSQDGQNGGCAAG